MDVLRCRVAVVVLIAGMTGSTSWAHAQDGGAAPPVSAPPAPTDAPVMEPPELLESAPAPYPEEAKALGLEGTVGLDITLDAEGRVTQVDVREPLGHGFDEAARAAARDFRFKPARQNGQPIPSRVRYPFVFRLAPLPATGALSLRVTRGAVPVAGAHVQVVKPDGATLDVVSDAAGEVRVGELAPGRYAIKASAADDLAAAESTVTIADAAVPVELALPPKPATPVLDVTVRGGRSEAQRLQQSAEAVNVIDTRRAKQQTADLGEVLARSQGIAIRREGGLGSRTRLSLNGLYDDQIRIFLDGVPLVIAGFPFGIANVPVNLIDRVEVYRGVVPVRFGADALGGAINLATEPSYRTSLNASYQGGSFNTHRATLRGRYRHDPSGFVAGVTAFIDSSDNDYYIDVTEPNDVGRPQPVRVRRFHDAYRAWSTILEVGVVDRKWAKRLLVKGVISGYDSELQHNLTMTVPYGEVEYGERVYGATAVYEVDLVPQLSLDMVAAYARRSIDLQDTAECTYNWYGDCIAPRRIPGEIDDKPHDQTIWEDAFYGRAGLKWKVADEHSLTVAISPAFTTRSGDERVATNPNVRDPLTAQQDLFTVISGLEYQLDLFDDKLSNIAFIKDYVYRANAEDAQADFHQRDKSSHSVGVGDSIRYRFTRYLLAKASYEYATRLPAPYEVFGNGVQIYANLGLDPEVSHNANIGPRLELRHDKVGYLVADINGFLRYSDKLIVLLLGDHPTYQNVSKAHGLGIENALAWDSPGRWVGLDGTVTWQDIRNDSDSGMFAETKGDRIPNRPYFFSSWGARVRVAQLPGPDDAITPYYNGRWVHSFYRGWESQGLKETKDVIRTQLTHALGVTYSLSRDVTKLYTTFAVENLTDAQVYDNFGVQKPGRGYYFKVTGEL